MAYFTSFYFGLGTCPRKDGLEISPMLSDDDAKILNLLIFIIFSISIWFEMLRLVKRYSICNFYKVAGNVINDV